MSNFEDGTSHLFVVEVKATQGRGQGREENAQVSPF